MQETDQETADVGRDPRLYTELASWWPLLSPSSHYAEEAADVLPTLLAAPDAPPRTLVELGCGDGSLASHLKGALTLTLTDRSPAMLEVSRTVNPDCEHVPGDMRSLDLGRVFDLVFVHDAIMYAADEASLRATLATAWRHCRPGGAAVIVPDCVRETFAPATRHGGEDGPDGRALRYLEWTWDPDPSDYTFDVAFAFLLRERDQMLRDERDRHRFGLFPRAAWLAWIAAAGFTDESRIDPWGRDIFVARRPRL
jgi:SAM-dependent methyltransferase